MYRRVLLKLSGEALGKSMKKDDAKACCTDEKADKVLFDGEQFDRVARVIKQASDMGTQVGVVIGAGNIWRGRKGFDGMNAVTADQMGMLSTVINCLCMKDALARAGQKACVMSAIDMPRVCETFRADIAVQKMEEGTVVLFAGGSGNPFFSTDTAVVLRALEVQADAILLAKNVKGIFTCDPCDKVHGKDAVFIPRISYREAMERNLRVMDTAALALCQEYKVPVMHVFGLNEPENILRVLGGENIGSVAYPEG